MLPSQLTMQTETFEDPTDPSTLLLNLRLGVAASNDLPWLLGLLLVLAQEVRVLLDSYRSSPF